MKVATVKLGWMRSASADVNAQKIEVTKNGELTTIDLPAEVEEFTLEVQAVSTVTFKVSAIDAEGNVATSDLYSFTLGDLEAPLAPTGLFHEILAVNDVPEA